MGHEREILNLLLEDHVFPLDWASDFSPEICITAASDQVAPSPPTGLVATAKLEGIDLEWTNPTTNADGTTCTDLWYVRVYYASKAMHDAEGSIDPDNSDTYDGVLKFATEERFHPVSGGAQYYYVVTAIDNTGNEGVASSEVNATALTVGASTDIPDDATGLIFDSIVTGDGILGIVTLVPATTWVGFDHYRLYYSVKNGSWGSWVEIGAISQYGYTHKSLDTSKVYKYKATVIGEDGTESSTADEDDNSGSGYQPDGADNSSVVAELVIAPLIIGTDEVRAESIKVTNLAAIIADLGTITAGSMDAARITTGTLVVARTQAKCTDALADQTSAHTAADTTLVNGVAAGTVQEGGSKAYAWRHASDVTKIDGGDIYTGSVTATQITVTNLAAINADMGTITAGSMDAARITTGTLVVARTQAKCTDALADQTSAHTAADATAYTGASIAVANTDAKCTDPNADQTSAHDCAHPGDYTATIINGGLITTGTISFNDGSVTKAGMTAVGAGDANVRIWAGATYANRATAPFRVTQAGICYATEFQDLTDTVGNAVISGGQFKGMTLLGTDEDANTGTNLALDIASLPASSYQRYIVFFEVAEEAAGPSSLTCRINGLAAANYDYQDYEGATTDATSWVIGWLFPNSCGIGTIEISTQYSMTRDTSNRWPSMVSRFSIPNRYGSISGHYTADVASVTRIQILRGAHATGWMAVYGVNYT